MYHCQPNLPVVDKKEAPKTVSRRCYVILSIYLCFALTVIGMSGYYIAINNPNDNKHDLNNNSNDSAIHGTIEKTNNKSISRNNMISSSNNIMTSTSSDSISNKINTDNTGNRNSKTSRRICFWNRNSQRSGRRASNRRNGSRRCTPMSEITDPFNYDLDGE